MSMTLELIKIRDMATRQVASSTDHAAMVRNSGTLNIVLSAVKMLTCPTREDIDALLAKIEEYSKSDTSARRQPINVQQSSAGNRSAKGTMHAIRNLQNNPWSD